MAGCLVNLLTAGRLLAATRSPLYIERNVAPRAKRKVDEYSYEAAGEPDRGGPALGSRSQERGPAERAAFAAWIKRSPQHLEAYLRHLVVETELQQLDVN